MTADFSQVAAHLANELVEHAKRDGLSPVARAVFLDRGGHAPGERCPSAPALEPIHAMTCDLIADGEWCTCGVDR